MIAQLKGTIIEMNFERDLSRVVLDVNGVGYEVYMPKGSESFFELKQTVILYVCESVTAFDGETTLYGFQNLEQKVFFNRLRQYVDGMGPKKAMECMEKITKSLPDFKRAIIEGDAAFLVSVFGFTRKMAEKLIFSLKSKIDSWAVSGAAKWNESTRSSEESEAVSGLINLGYRGDEVRDIVSRVKTKIGSQAKTEDILQEALKLLAGRF